MAAPKGRNADDTRIVVNVKQFLQSWQSDVTGLSLQASKKKEEENENIAKRMGVTADLIDELTAVCGADTLCCGNEPDDKADLLKMKGLPKDIDLTCVRYQERELERRRMVDYKLFVVNKMKYKVMDAQQMVPDPSSLERDRIAQDRLVPVPNVVLTIRVYRTRVSNTFLPKGEMFQVLGTQFLTELKDVITCMKDSAVAGEFSGYPDFSTDQLTLAKGVYKSGLFFIENVFYNDMREPDNRDYSAPILKWAREKRHDNVDLFRKAKMEDTRFLDLDIQLGMPYLYQHQGHCEHIVVFTDIRLLHCDDPQDKTLYPYLLSESVTRRTVCRACLMESARWMVFDSPLTPESPCFMCHTCFKMLHYDQDGQKICCFRAYMYPQKRSLH